MTAASALRWFALLWLLGASLAPSVSAVEKLPAQILDLRAWKLTLPIAGPNGKAQEVEPSALATFAHPEFFHANVTGDGVIFRAPCDGAVTKGSKYPRSELREMLPSGEKAAWSTMDATIHRLEWEGAILALPPKKPGAVCVQIHDAEDDVIMVRLERTELAIERNHQGDEPVLKKPHPLGERFRIRVEAGQGRIRVWYNDQLSLDWAVERSGCYFKAGCYTQSNTSKGEPAGAAGEVVVYQLKVTHAAP